MKKYFVLFLIIISLMTGCAGIRIAPKFDQVGRHYWNQKDPISEAEEDVKNSATTVRIADYTKVSVTGEHEETVEDVKEILDLIGFSIAQEGREEGSHYVIRAQRTDFVDKANSFYGYGYSDKRSLDVKVTLIIPNNKNGTEKRYSSDDEFPYAKDYWGYFYHSYWRELSPGRMAAKIAALKAIANFLNGERIPGYVLEK